MELTVKRHAVSTVLGTVTPVIASMDIVPTTVNRAIKGINVTEVRSTTIIDFSIPFNTDCKTNICPVDSHRYLTGLVSSN